MWASDAALPADSTQSQAAGVDYLPLLAPSRESAVTGLGSEIFMRVPQTEQ
jgi:hypothetical protein